MAAILSSIGKSSEFETEVVLESTPYENWYFMSREVEAGFEYISAHDDEKHVFFTPANDDIWSWEMWTVDEYTTSDDKRVKLLKSSHDTYIYMDHESGFIWQSDDPSSCNQDDLITIDITEYPTSDRTEDDEDDEDDEEETDPDTARLLILNARNHNSSKEEPEQSKKPTKNQEKTKKNTASGEDKPKRKPNIKLMAFQAYCKDYRSMVKDEHPEAKLGEQQKVLGDWWKNEEEEVRDKYLQVATRKAAETST